MGRAPVKGKGWCRQIFHYCYVIFQTKTFFDLIFQKQYMATQTKFHFLKVFLIHIHSLKNEKKNLIC